jgi:hypothetical protein
VGNLIGQRQAVFLSDGHNALPENSGLFITLFSTLFNNPVSFRTAHAVPA